MSAAYNIKPSDGKIRPIVRIVKKLGIDVRSSSRDLLKGCDALLRVIDGKYYIFVANDLSIEEQRLSIAHEFAHAILGHLLGNEDENYIVPYEQQEFEAEALGFILYNFLYGIDAGRPPES